MTRFLSNKYFVVVLLAIIAVVVLLFFAISISPLTPFEGYDSCVFKQMGEAFLQGKTPYLDLFDHKGPVLFLIDALGFYISNSRWGLFLLAVINLTLVLYVWYKTAYLLTGERCALLPVFVALLAYLGCMEEGNLTEDWSLLPNSYTLYLLTRFFAEKKLIRLYEYLLVGVMTGCVIFIRANNISITVCCAIYLSYILINRKQWVNLFKAYVAVLIGVFTVSCAIVGFFYFLYGSVGVEQMFFATFKFNFMYAGFSSYYDFIVSSMYNHAYFLGAILLIVFAYLDNKGRECNIEFSTFLAFSFIFCFYMMGTASFRHYMINVAPLFLISSSYAFRDSLKPYIVFVAFAVLTFEPFFKHQLQFSLGEGKRAYAKMYDDAKQIFDNVASSERNKIWNYNAEMTGIGVLQHCKLVQANRVVLNFQRGVSAELSKSENGKLEKVVPKYMLVDPTNNFVLPEDSIFINNNYEVIKEIRMDIVSKNTEEHRAVNILKLKNCK